MNATVLIDAIVRQTTVLIAQLATGVRGRATLAHTANQVFTSLVRELREQGVPNKGIADMFGLTLRTYHNKINRLAESSTDRGQSLFEALLSYVEQHGSVRRVDVLDRFSRDDERVVRSVLRELVDTGLLFRSGQGATTFYRAARPEEVPSVDAGDDEERLASLLWVAIKRFGPLGRSALDDLVPAEPSAIDRALSRLLEDRRIEQRGVDDRIEYAAEEVVITEQDAAGWEAAVFDHYQALVTTISAKLNLRRIQQPHAEWVGGSTYSYEVWKGHPLLTDALSFLRETRERALALRERIETQNRVLSAPPGGSARVVVYFGQSVLGLEDDENF